MELVKIVCLILTLQTILVVSLSAQVADSPRALKVEEFGASINCEEVLARLDNYFASLQNDPTAGGLIAVYGEKATAGGLKARNTRYDALRILGWMELRRFDASRITVVQDATGGGDARTEFWLVPAGATPPEIDGVPWSYDLSNLAEPYLLGTEYSDGVAGCTGGNPYLYAEFLKANPKMRGNIVIGASSPKNYRRRAGQLLDMLGEKGVLRRRLKTFFVKVKPNLLQESVEFWLIPPRRDRR
jgi:hypothetical protein